MKEFPFDTMRTRWYYCDTDIIIGTLPDGDIVLSLRRQGVPDKKVKRVLELTGFEIDCELGDTFKLKRSDNGKANGAGLRNGGLYTSEGAAGN